MSEHQFEDQFVLWKAEFERVGFTVQRVEQCTAVWVHVSGFLEIGLCHGGKPEQWYAKVTGPAGRQTVPFWAVDPMQALEDLRERLDEFEQLVAEVITELNEPPPPPPV